MDWLIIPLGGHSRRALVSPEARALFAQIASEFSGNPGVRVALDFRRPVIVVRRRLAAAGHEDGIAVRLEGDREQSALRLIGCRVLTRRDGMVVRGMVAMPWSTREHWRDMVRAAVAVAV